MSVLVLLWVAFWAVFLWFCLQAEPVGAAIAVALVVGVELIRRGGGRHTRP